MQRRVLHTTQDLCITMNDDTHERRVIVTVRCCSRIWKAGIRPGDVISMDDGDLHIWEGPWDLGDECDLSCERQAWKRVWKKARAFFGKQSKNGRR